MTIHISKILVCTDFSSYSDNALRMAKSIKQKTQCKVILLHVIEFPLVWDWMPPQYAEGRYESGLIHVYQEKIKEQQQKLDIFADEVILESGIAPSIIVDIAMKESCDLIIMGHRGQKEKILIGSLVEKIVSLSPVPVFITKIFLENEKTCALIDPIEDKKLVLQWLLYWHEEVKASTYILSLFPDVTARFIGVGKFGFSTKNLSLTNEDKQKMIKQLKKEIIQELQDLELKKDLYNDIHIIIEVSEERKLAFHLNHLLEEHKIDLAVMRKHQKNFLEKILIGSETKRMIEIFKKNLLILPSSK